MKSRLYISALFFFFLTALSAQNKLTINYPQWGWEDLEQGTIDEATFTLKPQGLYVEVGMYLTFSFPEYLDFGFSVYDSLEIVFDFNLPDEAIVNDSWLWVGDQVVRAEIWEIWTAMQTYDEIVTWQRDPSVLYKNPDGGYRLKIFPLVELQSRRVKINYLLPAHWTKEEVIATLPVELLSTSRNPIEDLKVLVFPDPAWENYRIRELPGQLFQPVSDPEFGPCLQMEMNSASWAQPVHFVMDAPLQPEGLFVGRYTGGEGNVYQLAFFPDQYLNTDKSSNLMVVVNYKSGNSDLSFEELSGFLKAALRAKLDENDFFNLVIGKDKNKFYMAFPTWQSADSASIETAFAGYAEIQQSTAIPLVDLILQAGAFIEDNIESGEMLLVPNTQEYLWQFYADEAIDEIQANLSGAIPIHICDFQNRNVYYDCPNWWIEENCSYGNEHFNLQLSVTTGGSFYSLLGNGADIGTNLATQLNTIDGVSVFYDLYTDMTSGLCYGRYPVHYLGQSDFMHLPILQVGKYEGNFPMRVEFSAFQNGQVISESFTIEENQVVELDTLAEESWVGNYLEVLEANESAVNQVIDISIHHRVLSKYTAFIALDPALGGEACLDCLFNFDNIIIETIDQETATEKSLSAFPNPFSDEIAIRLNGIVAKDVRIYDLSGRLVRILEPAPTLLWDGKNGDGKILPAGLYFLVVMDENGEQFEGKLMRL